MSRELTPAERLICKKLSEAIEEDYSVQEAVIHVANCLGLPQARVAALVKV